MIKSANLVKECWFIVSPGIDNPFPFHPLCTTCQCRQQDRAGYRLAASMIQTFHIFFFFITDNILRNLGISKILARPPALSRLIFALATFEYDELKSNCLYLIVARQYISCYDIIFLTSS